MGARAESGDRAGAADRADDRGGARRPRRGQGSQGSTGDVSRAPRIDFICGGTGAGKSSHMKAELRRLDPGRLIVVDPDGEYHDCGPIVRSARDLMMAVQSDRFRVRLVPDHNRAQAERQFAFACSLVRWLVDPAPGQVPPVRTAPVVLACDELADFVGPSFRESPDAWQWLLRRGRKHGVTLAAASQRPAMIDKTLFSLCTTIRAYRLGAPADCATIAEAIGVPRAEVLALSGHAWIERNRLTGEIRRG